MSGSWKEARTVSKGTVILIPRLAGSGETGGLCGRRAAKKPVAAIRMVQLRILGPSESRVIGISFSSSFRSGEWPVLRSLARQAPLVTRAPLGPDESLVTGFILVPREDARDFTPRQPAFP